MQDEFAEKLAQATAIVRDLARLREAFNAYPPALAVAVGSDRLDRIERAVKDLQAQAAPQAVTIPQDLEQRLVAAEQTAKQALEVAERAVAVMEEGLAVRMTEVDALTRVVAKERLNARNRD